MSGFLGVVSEVTLAMVPLVLFFLVFQALFLKYPRERLKKILFGMLIAGMGMILFLYAVYSGFVPISEEIGTFMVENLDPWMIIAFGFLIGFLVTFAEPAVRVLVYQVEKHSTGFMRAELLLVTLSVGVGFFVALGMAKVVYGLDFKIIIISGYLVAVLLMLLCDRDFVSVAFDAGGVATGPISVALLMAMMTAMAPAIPGSDPLTDGFGIIALIAMAPIIFVTGLGAIMRFKQKESVQT